MRQWGCWPLAASCRIICTPPRRSLPAKQVTAYSVTDSIEASRGNAREALSGDTSYVTVKINGKTRVVPGMHFTDVKSVLDAGDITLDTEDTVSPSLDTKVNENNRHQDRTCRRFR